MKVILNIVKLVFNMMLNNLNKDVRWLIYRQIYLSKVSDLNDEYIDKYKWNYENDDFTKTSLRKPRNFFDTLHATALIMEMFRIGLGMQGLHYTN